MSYMYIYPHRFMIEQTHNVYIYIYAPIWVRQLNYGSEACALFPHRYTLHTFQVRRDAYAVECTDGKDAAVVHPAVRHPCPSLSVRALAAPHPEADPADHSGYANEKASLVC